ncbi:MAG: thioredoxin [Oscillospiraceae bacterium]
MLEIRLTKENFKTEVLESDKPVMVDFWAEWCGPCKMIAPVVSEIAAEYQAELKVGKVNVDESPEIADAFRISSIPSIIIFKEGKPVCSSIGYKNKEYLSEMVKNCL